LGSGCRSFEIDENLLPKEMVETPPLPLLQELLESGVGPSTIEEGLTKLEEDASRGHFSTRRRPIHLYQPERLLAQVRRASSVELHVETFGKERLQQTIDLLVTENQPLEKVVRLELALMATPGVMALVDRAADLFPNVAELSFRVGSGEGRLRLGDAVVASLLKLLPKWNKLVDVFFPSLYQSHFVRILRVLPSQLCVFSPTAGWCLCIWQICPTTGSPNSSGWWPAWTSGTLRSWCTCGAWRTSRS
jgi:hypothetical protein